MLEQLPPNPGCYVYSISVSVSAGGIVFCGLKTDCLTCYANNIALSTDNGLTWATPGWDIYGGQLFDFRGQDVITTGGHHCVGGGGNWSYLSFDYGQTWLEFPLIHCCVSSLNLCLNGNILSGMGLDGTYTDPGLMLSTDSCNSWTKVSCLKPSVGISIESGGILAGSDSLGVFLFSDDGDSLGSRNDGLTNLNIHTLTIDNNDYVYAGTDNGVWRRALSQIVPVELISFNAATNGKEVILNWSTATELNNLGFEIQRSIEEEEFFTVGFVNGHGTTTEQQNYSYSDRNLDDGKYFYRLKQVDYDGSYEYSDVVEVDYRGFNSYLLEQNFPNPFNPTTTIGFGLQNKSNVKITILNAIGEEVAVLLNKEKEAGFHQVEFNAASLPSGVYFYQLLAGSFVETKKMLLLK